MSAADPVSAAATAATTAAGATATAAQKAAMGTSSTTSSQAAAAGQAATTTSRSVMTTVASNIAVSIDRPLMTDGMLPYHSTTTATTTTSSSLASSSSSSSSGNSNNIIASARAVVAQALASLWAKPVIRMAVLVLVTGLALSWLVKQQQQQQQQLEEDSTATEETTPESAATTGGIEEEGSSSSTISRLMRHIKGRFQRVMERFEGQPQDVGVPMPFMDANEGWGVCTLASRKRLGKSSFVQYEFDLPQPDYVLPLDLGQQVSMCCLDNEGNVARGDFFPFAPNNNHGGKKGRKSKKKKTTGSFSILLPNHKSPDKNIFAMGLDASNFARVVKNELKIGDEVALKPGKHRLAYRGQYLPVTDMVYVAFGTGIVPVLDQIRAVLPTGTSSVKSVTVVWINEATRDFDVTAAILEQEYFKYSQKLAVSCIVDDLHYKDFAENTEVNDAIPNFQLGAMAVVAGPAELKDKAMSYLEHERGYPRDTICVL
jgi:preprotein translocase subunit SecG